MGASPNLESLMLRLPSVALLCSMFASVALAQPAERAAEAPTLAPGPNDAVVYFVRPGMMGLVINFWAFVDEKPVGMTKGDTHVVATVPAGEHVLWSRSGNVSSLKVNLEAGKTYYVKQEPKVGGLRARVNIELIDEAAGREAVEKTKYSALTAEDAERSAEFVAAEYQEAVTNARAPSGEQ
jgi:hypothetical protein